MNSTVFRYKNILSNGFQILSPKSVISVHPVVPSRLKIMRKKGNHRFENKSLKTKNLTVNKRNTSKMCNLVDFYMGNFMVHDLT